MGEMAPDISCYFTEAGIGRKFQPSVFRDYRTGEYRLKGNDIDFACCPLGVLYGIKVVPNQKGRMVFEHVKLKEAR